ncbi:META domain-containing protein [Winogradskyella algicola]|uniref:META domain-containing protein n=1 Tax=Winogradskyella algicola TaxID=2575815 RepID=UPI001108ABD2|nr:META domain-containing protein [Winogradskyella algicola]
MKFLLSIFTLAILTGSCNSKKATHTEQKKHMQQSGLSGTYKIKQLESKDVSFQNLTITFNDSTNQVSGFSGCNNFFSNYTIKENTIKFGPVAASKKYCGTEKNNLESTFLKALNNVNSFIIKNDSFSFTNETTEVFTATKSLAAKPSKSAIVKDNYKKFMVIYETSTRGAFKHIGISKSEITISKDRNLKEIDTFECKPKDWKELNELLSNSLVENLDLLEPPTQNRLHDGAPNATLSVVKGDVVMMTPTFDHGYPPKEIETLVNKVLSMAENATKQ